VDSGHEIMASLQLALDDLRRVLQALPAGVVVLDEEGRVLFYNDAEARLSGRHVEDVEGADFFREVAPCTDVRELAGAFRHAMADPDRTLDEDLEFVFPFSGGEVDVRIRMRKAVIDGRQLGLLVIDENTQLKQTERALQAALGEARELAFRDPLTNLYNRRHLQMVVPKDLGRIQRYAYPLSVVMVDLDHFKGINDRYGHAAGDRALLGVAQALLRSLRATDYCCRVGGEEFCVILPGTGAEDAAPVVERIREAIRRVSLEGISDLRLTASLGVSFAEHPPPEHRMSEEEIRCEIESLVRAADDALFEAKSAGRDRFVLGRWERAPEEPV
jgi:photoactive yellow protein